MRRILLVYLLTGLSYACLAQRVALQGTYQSANSDIPSLSKYGVPEVQVVGTVIGTSLTDLQSNGSVYNNVFINDNNVSAVWNYNDDLIPTEHINNAFFDGVAWIAQTDTTGFFNTQWPNIAIDTSGIELIVTRRKNPGNTTDHLMRASGVTQWTPMGPIPSSYQTNWPRMSLSGQTVHCIASAYDTGPIVVNGVGGNLLYFRSSDMGFTWNIIDATFPGLDSTNFLSVEADQYALDSKGSIVAVLTGGFINDLVLWKSTDGGDTWIQTIIWEFPFGPAPYNPVGNITDVDFDGVADTVATFDGSLEVLIDNNGMVHCWAGRMKILDEDVSLSPEIGFINMTDGLMYWNESFGGSGPQMIAYCIDLDLSGYINVTDIPTYNGKSMCSFPTAALDTSGIIFLAYSGVVENTSGGAPMNYSYRNIYMMFSEDNGTTWTYAYNIMQSDFEEGVFPSLARDANGFAHLVYSLDDTPGLAAYNDHPIVVSDIIYNKFSTNDIINPTGPPVIPNNSISGQSYLDVNGNGIYDIGTDTILPYQVIVVNAMIYPNTSGTGQYSAILPLGNHQVTALVPAGWQLTTTPSIYNVNLSGTPVTGIDFGFQPLSPVDSVAGGIVGFFPRCNQTVLGNLAARNMSTDIRDVTLTLSLDPNIVLINATPSATNVGGNVWEWNFTSLLPNEIENVGCLFGMPPSGIIQNTLITELFDSGTLLFTDNDTLIQTVVCSFDPNQKWVIPAGNGTQHLTAFDVPLTYTVDFQNTGTDTAFKVVIRDVIEEDLDISTLTVLGASHAYTFTVDVSQRELVITFDNINLPDSNVNELMSHGFVTFRIYPLNGLPEATEIENTAHIFFDYNLAIITNTTLNTLSTFTGLEEMDSKLPLFYIYPNPMTGNSVCRITGTRSNDFKLEISDISGRLIFSEPVAYNGYQMPVSSLPAGIFIVTLSDKETGEIYRTKVVK